MKVRRDVLCLCWLGGLVWGWRFVGALSPPIVGASGWKVALRVDRALSLRCQLSHQLQGAGGFSARVAHWLKGCKIRLFQGRRWLSCRHQRSAGNGAMNPMMLIERQAAARRLRLDDGDAGVDRGAQQAGD